MYQALKTGGIYQAVIRNLDPEQIIPFEDYCRILDNMACGGHTWPLPRRIEICKSFSQKRRIVFNYPKAEMFVLRAVNYYLFRKCGKLLSPSYYPFPGHSPAQCLGMVLNKFAQSKRIKGLNLEDFHGMHFDVSDYFNSMNPSFLLDRLPEEIRTDRDFVRLFEQTLGNPYCIDRHKIVRTGKKGAMAGLPVSAFFAAVYLSEMDKHFDRKGIPYARYSDDILLFAENREDLAEYGKYVEGFITSSGLSVNREKTETINPGEPWTFIGFEIDHGTIDLALHSEEKIKRRVGRWARRLRKRVEVGYNNGLRKTTPEKAAQSLIRGINRALFKPIRDKYSWARWMFSTINSTKRLETLDLFIQEKIRYVYTGRYTRANYRALPYEKMAKLGYYPLLKLFNLYRYRPEKYQEFMEKFVIVPEKAKG